MAILVISNPERVTAWRAAFADNFPDEQVRDGTGFDDGMDIDIVVMGPPVEDLFARLPNLKLVISTRAGIDDLITDPDLAPGASLCRAQDPSGDRMLDDYALLLTLFHHRNMPDLLAANATVDRTLAIAASRINGRSVTVKKLTGL